MTTARDALPGAIVHELHASTLALAGGENMWQGHTHLAPESELGS
jgi:hypothetical protein